MQRQLNKKYAERQNYWRELIKKREESGLSAAEFCRQQGIAHSRYSNWYNRFLKQDMPISPTRFVPVKIKSEKMVDQSSGIILSLKNDIQLRIESNSDKAALKTLFEVLGVLPC